MRDEINVNVQIQQPVQSTVQTPQMLNYDPPTVTVGTTTTGEAGSSATVTNVGTAKDLVLNFSIPKGDKGDQGDPGVNGADKDLSNVTAVGTSSSAGWAMPSGTYEILTVGANGSTYTAPSNGYLVARGTASASGQYLELVAENVDSLIHSSAAALDISVFIPILKGKTAALYYSTATPTVTFVYAKGSKSEAN